MQSKSFAKINIFLKIVGRRNGYHLLNSRFIKIKHIYDIIEFKKKATKNNLFEIEGNFNCDTLSNTIYKSYLLLNYPIVKEFFKEYKVVVKKNIPSFAGLGGGSSNSAVFLKMVNEICNLKLSKKQLANIGLNVGADVPFFIYDFDSANVTGIGENIKEFNDDIPKLEIFTPNINCSTKEVFKKYKELDFNFNTKFYDNLTTKELLNTFNIAELNDLFLPATILYPKLLEVMPKKSFFSGSGSSFFFISK